MTAKKSKRLNLPNLKVFTFVLMGSAVLWTACKKDINTGNNNNGGNNNTGNNNTANTVPTPYKYQYPSWVKNVVGEVAAPADNPTTVEGVALGRRLFYDKRLSSNGQRACASCHIQSNNFTDNEQFVQGNYNGTNVRKRTALQLVNVGYMDKLFWDGRKPSLEAQVSEPITHPAELNNTWKAVLSTLSGDPNYKILFYNAFHSVNIDSNQVMKALAQFERTFVSFNSPYDKYAYGHDENAISESAKSGMNIFYNVAKCGTCHSGPLFTDMAFHTSGFEDPFDKGLANVTGRSEDIGKYRTPSIRNIELKKDKTHNGQFSSLSDLLDNHNSAVRLSYNQKVDLIEFINSLSDADFISNTALSDPGR